MSKVALVVHACDKYKLLYQGFEYFFEKYWDKAIPCKLYFTYEVEQPQLALFETIPTGTGAWTTRLGKGFDQITEDYILFFQEDFWLKTATNALFFNQLFDYVTKHQTNLIKLHHSSGYHIKNNITTIGAHPLYELEKATSTYLLSHQISIWKKDFFMEQIQKEESPWQNEIWGTERIKKMNTPIYSINYFQCNEDQPSINGSQYYTVSKHAKLNSYIEFFFEELAEDKKLSEYYNEIFNHYKNGWTHDKGAQPFTLSLWDRILLKIKR